MIKNIEMINFQSHKHSIINFDSGLNVIVGPTDSGKTAILRAFRWVAYNTAPGDFIRVGASKAIVTITVENEGKIQKVTRERSRGSINRYIITDENGNEKVLEGFGTSVPLEVQKILGVREVDFGGVTLRPNMLEQLDGPFLGKSVSAPNRAKVLGKLAGTEKIDKANKELGTDLYRKGQEEKRIQKDLKQLEESISEYDYLPAMKERIDTLEDILEKLKKDQEIHTKLVSLKNNLANIKREYGRMLHILDNLNLIIPETEIILNSLILAIEHHKRLKMLQTKFNDVLINIEKNEKVITETAEIDNVLSVISSINHATEQYSRLVKLYQKYISIGQSEKNNQSILAKTQFVDDIINDLGKMRLRINTYKLFKTFKEKLDRIIKQEAVTLQRITKTDSVNEVFEIENSIRNKIKEFFDLQKWQKQMNDLTSSINTAQKRINELKQKAEKAETDYINTLKQLGICPLCGNKVDENKLKEVI